MTSYVYNITDFLNQKANPDRLTSEIHSSIISIALDHIDTDPLEVEFSFKTDLSTNEKEALDIIVANHTGEPLEEIPPIVKAQILTEAPSWVIKGETTQALFAAESLIIDVSAGDIEIAKSFSWKYDIAIKSATIYVSEDMIGDEIVVHEAPNTLIGYLTQTLNVGDTSIYVSDTVLENIKKAYYVGLYVPGEEGIEISQVMGINLQQKALTIYPASDISANPYSYVAMCSKMIPKLVFTSTQKIEVGKTIPTASRLPANIPVRVYYKNNNGKSKKLSIFVEYLY